MKYERRMRGNNVYSLRVVYFIVMYSATRALIQELDAGPSQTIEDLGTT